MATGQQRLMVAITQMSTQHTLMTGHFHDIVCQQIFQLQQTLTQFSDRLEMEDSISRDRSLFRATGELLGH